MKKSLKIVLISSIVLSVLFLSVISTFFIAPVLKNIVVSNRMAVAEDDVIGETGNGESILADQTYPFPEKIVLFKSGSIDAPVLLSGETESDSSASFTLTATIEPLTANNQNVLWSTAWQNAESEWAFGKDVADYVIVTPVQNTLEATVTCLAPFGEQVVIKVSSDENTSLYATCVCDYAPKLTPHMFIARGNVPSNYAMTDIDFSGSSDNPLLTFFVNENFTALGDQSAWSGSLRGVVLPDLPEEFKKYIGWSFTQSVGTLDVSESTVSISLFPSPQSGGVVPFVKSGYQYLVSHSDSIYPVPGLHRTLLSDRSLSGLVSGSKYYVDNDYAFDRSTFDSFNMHVYNHTIGSSVDSSEIATFLNGIRLNSLYLLKVEFKTPYYTSVFEQYLDVLFSDYCPVRSVTTDQSSYVF